MFFEIGAVFLIMFFIGFAVGRYGDKWGGHLNTPHHWIYGLLLIIVGIIFIHNNAGIVALSFGIGHFLSDLNDFINMRFYGPDEPHDWKFWSIK